MKKEEDDKWIYGGLKGPCFYYYLITYSYIKVQIFDAEINLRCSRSNLNVRDRIRCFIQFTLNTWDFHRDKEGGFIFLPIFASFSQIVPTGQKNNYHTLW